MANVGFGSQFTGIALDDWLQQEKSRLLNITEAVYYDIIRQKTASLIAACCAGGGSGRSAGASRARLEEKK